MDVADLKNGFIGFEMGFRIYQIGLANLDKSFNDFDMCVPEFCKSLGVFIIRLVNFEILRVLMVLK